MNKPERLPSQTPVPSFFDALENRAGRPAAVGATLHRMIALGLDQLCLPGQGLTLSRWQALAAVAAQDLSLVKLFEAHTDALAILAEASAAETSASAGQSHSAPMPAPPWVPPHAAWAVWCAEPPDARVVWSDVHGEQGNRSNHGNRHAHGYLSGTKAWCSGAAAVTHALVSCHDAQGRPCLAAVALAQPGVHVTDQGWHAVGMADTGSVNVEFDHARARQVGPPGFYTGRPGFWHGGAGIAACWYGAAARLADHLRGKLAARNDPDAIALAQLGKADAALSAAAALLRESARWIDACPDQDAQAVVLRARLATEQAALAVIAAAGQTLGAALYCREPFFARLLADLPVFLRQSHADRDYAALARCALDGDRKSCCSTGHNMDYNMDHKTNHDAGHRAGHEESLWAL